MDKTSPLDVRFDLLKTLALIALMLAHAFERPPQIIFDLRNFDVPLMVIISGSLFVISRPAKGSPPFLYIIQRVRRLVVPCWIFLSVFFSAFFVISLLRGEKYGYSAKHMLDAFLLGKSIGYLWVIRVFVMLTVVAPLLQWLRERSGPGFIFLVLALYGLYETAAFLYPDKSLFSYNGFSDSPHWYLIPYSSIFVVGMFLPGMRRSQVGLLAVAFFAVFCVVFLWNNPGFIASPSWNYISPQNFKYPPRLYYISYGVFVSLLLYFLVYPLSRTNPAAEKLLRFIGKASLSIYLWHIGLLYAWKLLIPARADHLNHYAVQTFSIFTASIGLAFLQARLLAFLSSGRKLAR